MIIHLAVSRIDDCKDISVSDDEFFGLLLAIVMRSENDDDDDASAPSDGDENASFTGVDDGSSRLAGMVSVASGGIPTSSSRLVITGLTVAMVPVVVVLFARWCFCFRF
jgi:hypothetical protein